MERSPSSDGGDSPNARTVESYELIADDYARETAGAAVLAGGLTRLAETVPGGHALEIGSGPGWDADALEEAGMTVRRTDVTQAFIEFQRARGKEAERLDVIPAQFRVLVVRRPKYACRACETMVQAPAPARLIEGGLPTEAR